MQHPSYLNRTASHHLRRRLSAPARAGPAYNYGPRLPFEQQICFNTGLTALACACRAVMVELGGVHANSGWPVPPTFVRHARVFAAAVRCGRASALQVRLKYSPLSSAARASTSCVGGRETRRRYTAFNISLPSPHYKQLGRLGRLANLLCLGILHHTSPSELN